MSEKHYRPKVALVYDHEHGVSVSVYASMEAARKGACEIIVENWEDIDDKEARYSINLGLKAQDWQEVIDVWNVYQLERCGAGKIESFYFERIEKVWGTKDLVIPELADEEEPPVERKGYIANGVETCEHCVEYCIAKEPMAVGNQFLCTSCGDLCVVPTPPLSEASS